MDHARGAAGLSASVDARGANRVLSYPEPDASCRNGSNLPAPGIEAIRVAVDGFFAAVGSLSHELRHVRARDGQFVGEGAVTCTRHDGRAVGIPLRDVCAVRGERVRDHRAHLDPAPRFAP